MKLRTNDLKNNLEELNKLGADRHPYSEVITFSLNDKEDRKIRLSTRNERMSIFIKCDMLFEDFKELNFCVNKKDLYNFVKSLKNDYITISEEDNLMIFKSGRRKMKLVKFELEIPVVDYLDNVESFEFDSGLFKSSYDKSYLSVATEPIKPILTGINIKNEYGFLKTYACDSKRASCVSLGKIENDFNIVIEPKFLKIVNSLVSDKISIKSNAKTAIFESGNMIITSSLLEGVYPDVSHFVRSKNESKIAFKVNKNDFQEMINNFVNFNPSSNSYIDFDINENEMKLKSINKSNKGQVLEDYFEVKNLQSGYLKISLGTKYLLEALKMIKSEEVEFAMYDEVSPIMIYGDSVQVISPIRTT